MAIAPIWKDYIVNLGSYDSIPFRIKIQDDIIYNGKAHRKPNETDINIRINDVCADYLINALPALSQAEFSALSFPLAFMVEAFISSAPGADPDWEEIEEVQFINDWSYDNSYVPSTMGMSFPINGRIDARQWLTYTAYNAQSINATITFKDGTSAQVIIPIAISADFSADFNDDFSRSARSAGSGTAVFDLSEWDDVASVTIGNTTWKVVSDCEEWALYYVNAFGGWDSLLIEGLTSQRDELERHTREMEYDNRDIKNRGLQNYVNEMSNVFTMHTSWMSDDESARMHHLLNSTEVYLGNIGTGEMMPVILNNTTTEYKTYKGNGGRLVNYTIDATLAQDRTRR